jgi:hypothetical protein
MQRFVYYFTHLDASFGLAASMLCRSPAEWLPPPAEVDGEDDCWQVVLRADGALPGTVAALKAVLEVGPPKEFPAHLVRSVQWRAGTAQRLFPVFDGELELEPLEGWGCQLSLGGTYRPPMSVGGGLGDRLVGHRVAEACVRRFVLDVAARLAASAAEVG